MDVHTEVVRSLVKTGWLAGAINVEDGHRRLVIQSDELESFNAKYVTAGALARSIKLNPTNFAEKLTHMGILAVAGPRIDGTLVYLFRRADITGVDLLALKDLRGYATRTGRRPHGQEEPKLPGVALTDAAKFLQISEQLTSALIQKGLLDEELTLSREVRVTEQSLANVSEKVFSTQFMSVAAAAELVGYSEHQFRVYFIETGAVKLFDLYAWQFVHESDLSFLFYIRDNCLTAAEAGKMLGMHRSFLPNYERTLKIKSHIIGTKRKIKFYERSCVERLAKEINIQLSQGIVVTEN